MKINNIKLNFLKSYCMFYDWLSTDNLQMYNNIYLYKIPPYQLDDLINYKVIIEDRKQFKNNIIVLTDSYNFIGLCINEKGETESKSSIMLSDEIKLLNKLDELDCIKLIYRKLEFDYQFQDLRINEEIKNFIHEEIFKIISNNDIKKLEYIYYEWFQKKESNPLKMLKNIEKQLKLPISKRESNIYDLMKMSYKLV